jgi:hypothetical protein
MEVWTLVMRVVNVGFLFSFAFQSDWDVIDMLGGVTQTTRTSEMEVWTVVS